MSWFTHVLQAICELLTVAGKTLDAASAQSKQRTTAYFSTLDKYMNSKTLPSRTRFMVRDLVELRRSNWIPRRAALQVCCQNGSPLHLSSVAVSLYLDPLSVALAQVALTCRKPCNIFYTA